MPLTLLAALLFSAVPGQDPEPGKCFVKEGRTGGVFYGMSPVMDLWGNFRRMVWTLKADGTLVFGAPEGGFEEFAKRALTANEQKEASTYGIDGEKFHFSYRDGSTSEGKVEYNPDGSIKRINAAALNFYPVYGGVDGPLSGYWSNSFSFNNGALAMRTTSYNCFSLFANGIFVLESGASTIATAVQTRTVETATTIETIREAVTKFYGSDPASKMGRFEVKGSHLLLKYDNGTTESRYLGRIGALKAGESGFLLIGNALYDGALGVFPKSSAPAPASGAAPAPPPGLARCKSDQFDLAVPAGWTARKEDAGGLQAFLVTPAGAAPDDPAGQFTLVLTGTALDDRSTQASDPAMIASLEALVTSWCKTEKVRKTAGPEKFKIGTTDAVRLRYSIARDGGTVLMDAACAVRDGNALVALTIASEAAEKKHGEGARELLGRVAVSKLELQHVKGPNYELDLPKDWKTKQMEQNGAKSLLIVPPSGEAEYVIQIIGTDAGTHATATEPGAIQELRDLVKQLAPAMSAVGDAEALQSSGKPAAGVMYAGRNEKDETILVKAYLALSGKQAIVMLVVGKEPRDKEYGAHAKRAFTSLKFKE